MSDNARPRLVSALAAWSRAAAAEVVVARSAEVVDVDADGCVSVRMLTPIQEVVAGSPRWVEAPILPRIPVAYMAIGDLTITAAPSIGDRGLVLVRDVAHGEVDDGQGGAVVSPEDPRRWDPVDAVYLPVALTDSRWSTAKTPATGGAVVLAAGTALRVGSATGSSAVALAQQTNARLEALETFASTHVHTGGVLSGALTGTQNGTAPSGSSVASSRLLTDD